MKLKIIILLLICITIAFCNNVMAEPSKSETINFIKSKIQDAKRAGQFDNRTDITFLEKGCTIQETWENSSKESLYRTNLKEISQIWSGRSDVVFDCKTLNGTKKECIFVKRTNRMIQQIMQKDTSTHKHKLK